MASCSPNRGRRQTIRDLRAAMTTAAPSGLFGSQTGGGLSTAPTGARGLFGTSTTGGGLFGQSGPAGGGGLFGQQQPNSTGLFGGGQTPSGSLFSQAPSGGLLGQQPSVSSPLALTYDQRRFTTPTFAIRYPKDTKFLDLPADMQAALTSLDAAVRRVREEADTFVPPKIDADSVACTARLAGSVYCTFYSLSIVVAAGHVRHAL